MLLLQRIALFAVVASSPAWAQSNSAPERPSDSTGQPSQSSQSAPNSDKKASPDETPPASGPEDSTRLEPLKTEKAIYPLQAQQRQLQGQVWVKILVSETGAVESVEVISGDPVLADAAVDAVKKWKFKPFIKNGKPVKVSTKLPMDFAFVDQIHREKVPPAAGDATRDTTPAAGGDAPKRVRVSAGVTTGLLVYKVQPIYPIEARRAHIQGVVVLQAKISKEGRIVDLQLISGPKELADAAIGAVQQWRYRPYLLKGEPLEVETQVQVNFQLGH